MSFRIPHPPPDGGAWRATLDRASAVLPAETARARGHLAEALRPTSRSALGRAAWASCGLTPTGYPVELAVTSAAAEVRWVASVLAPEDDPAHAADVVIDRAARAGATPPRGLVREVARLQEGAELRFGAWLGARHGSGGDRWKAYVELPAGTGWGDLPTTCSVAAGALAGVATPCFVGVPLDTSGAVETYARVRIGAVDAVALMAGRCGWGSGAPLTDRLAQLADRPGAPAPHHLSLSIVTVGEEVVALAVFTFARRLWGSDAAARTRVHRLATTEGWPSAALYDALSRPLAATHPPASHHHGPVSVVLHADERVETHVGLAPPPPAPSSPHQVLPHRSTEQEPLHV